MSEMFHSPEGALQTNLGLLAGTVIRELRMHPYIDDELEGGHWNYRPEYLEFTVLSVRSASYRCQYSGEADTFWWSIWREQPNHGFMRDGCTPVRYYIKEEPLPPPYYLGVDAHLTETVTPQLQDAGIQVIAISQTMTGMSPAMKELERMLRKREMLHVHNTCARWCFNNVRCAVDGNENMKPMKDRSIGRIDVTVAWIIAVAAWLVYKAQNPFDKTKLGEDWGL